MTIKELYELSKTTVLRDEDKALFTVNDLPCTYEQLKTGDNEDTITLDTPIKKIHSIYGSNFILSV